jgi:hypothetical protein
VPGSNVPRYSFSPVLKDDQYKASELDGILLSRSPLLSNMARISKLPIAAASRRAAPPLLYTFRSADVPTDGAAGQFLSEKNRSNLICACPARIEALI